MNIILHADDSLMQEEGIKKNIYDVAVIGAGPAGMMAAIQASDPEHSRRVVLIEKNKQLGKKLLLTGNGRCNLTNAEFNLKKLTENYNNGEFLFHAFFVFGPKETVAFFENLGVKTKIEAGKRVFPVSDEAPARNAAHSAAGGEKVLEALKKELKKNKVEILLNSEVVAIENKKNKISKIILKSDEITAKKYILATGGKSYSSTGSDGFGYKLAEKLGHIIIKPIPALCPIRLKEEWIKNLQGISLKNIKINTHPRIPGIRENGEIMFTHYGISGPAILDISGKIGELLEKGETKIFLDLFPELNYEEVSKSFEEILKKYPRQIIKNILSDFLPERFADVFLTAIGIDKIIIANNMPKIEKTLIVKNLKNFELTPEDISDFDQAMVTSGGISLKEIDHKTMQSKIIDNLFFAGEIIDVDGKTGGFNLQMCWSTGHIAGNSIL